MLTHPTGERLMALGLAGMAKALEEQRENRTVEGLSFEERLALLVDRETAARETKRLAKRLKTANLRQDAIIEDFDPTTKRTLDKALFAKLATGDWIRRRQDLIVTAKTGPGKSWLACALAHKACRDDRSAVYWRVPNLLDDLALARGDGRLRRRMKALGAIPDPTVADAVLDRLVHTAHRLKIEGKSLRDPDNKTQKRGKIDT